jgi:hypothetical protein
LVDVRLLAATLLTAAKQCPATHRHASLGSSLPRGLLNIRAAPDATESAPPGGDVGNDIAGALDLVDQSGALAAGENTVDHVAIDASRCEADPPTSLS